MSKKRVSLTLEESVVDRLDSESEREGVNRSQLVEEIVSEHFESRGLDTAVILCGDPELKSLELHNGRSILSNILNRLSDQGITRGILLTGRNRDEIEGEFGKSYEGVSMEYFEDKELDGSARALESIETEINGPFLIVNGHVIAEVDLGEMHRFHRSNDSKVTMALTTVEKPSEYGVARLKGRDIVGFEEKPESGEEPSRLINAGTYIANSSLFEEINRDSLEDVFEDLASDRSLSGYIYGGKWHSPSC